MGMSVLMRYSRPDVGAAECERALCLKSFAEQPGDTSMLTELIQEDVLYSIVLADGIGACKQWNKQCEDTRPETAANQQAAKRSTTRVWASKAFGGGTSSSSAKPKPRAKPKTPPPPKPKPRWYAQISEGDVEVVQDMTPLACTIFADH